MSTTIVGYPRIGADRELKFASEQYFKGEVDAVYLQNVAKALRLAAFETQQKAGISSVPCNDFSFYDGVLDTSVLLGAVPQRYRDLNLSPLDTYFAMARGYQGPNGDVKALAMKKWFNTNYHYMVPEIDDNTRLTLNPEKPISLFKEAKACGAKARPVVVGPYTFLKLARYTGKLTAKDFAESAAEAYAKLLDVLAGEGAEWVQLDEPSLVTDMSEADIKLFIAIYKRVLAKKRVHVLLQTYFGDVRDCYSEILSLPFDGIGLDFIEGKKSLNLVKKYGFPKDKTLYAGVVNGKNIWRNNYKKTLVLLKELAQKAENIVVSTGCSLLHVPYTLKSETKLADEYKRHLAFAEEKLTELCELDEIFRSQNGESLPAYKQNAQLFITPRTGTNTDVHKRLEQLKGDIFTRKPDFYEREKIQKEEFKLPLLPTTTIGSFPQTADVKAARSKYRKGELAEAEYEEFIKGKIAACISLQEQIGLDVLVHGEYERNDMVEYFGECLEGYIFTEKAWVQSYGTRCVKPPVIWGDVSRTKPMTVKWSTFAQSCTKKPVKGMLTGPVTILNWSFPREDISLKDSAFQLALAVREEALDLEKNGIKIIQVDEAALREKLPLRKADWRSEYLDWAIPAFRIVHSGLKPTTQLHTHMCYSEFGDIIKDIDNMDADVITFEASRSDLTVLEALQQAAFRTEVGPGVYDIHSPRVPSKEEIKTALKKMLKKIPKQKLWVNPDCGLKTRGESETVASLKNLVAAAKELRDENL